MTQTGVVFRHISVRTSVFIRNDHRLIMARNRRCPLSLLPPNSTIRSLMFIALNYSQKCVLHVHDVPVSCGLSVTTISRRLHHLIRLTIYSVRKSLISSGKENNYLDAYLYEMSAFGP